jgi:hypothetical protein
MFALMAKPVDWLKADRSSKDRIGIRVILFMQRAFARNYSIHPVFYMKINYCLNI